MVWSDISRRFYTYLLEPRSKDEDSRRREFILNVLLLGSLLLSSITFIIVLTDITRLGSAYRGADWYVVLFPLLVFGTLYFLSRWKFYRVSAFALILLYFLYGLYALRTWGLLLAQGWLVSVLVVVMAAVLIGPGFAFVMGGIIAVNLLVLAYLFSQNVIAPNLYWANDPGDLKDAVVFIFVLGVIALISWLSNREIELSLTRARNSEADLQKERDLLEIKVEERTRELREAQHEKITQMYRLAAFGRSAAGLFHDLVNPLTTVSLNLEQMGSKEGSQLVKRAMEGAKKMERFILAARKQIQDQKELTRFSLAEEIRQAIEVLYFKTNEEKVNVEFQASNNVRLYGNAVKFYQVVTNLLTNAVDSYKGSRTTNRKVLIKLEPIGRRVRLSIRDDGRGIPARYVDKIFDPFFTTKEVGHGTGLGLSIVKDIVEKDFGGRISVESKEGDGSTFIVELPMRQNGNIKSARV